VKAVNLIPSDQRRSGVSVGVGAGRSGGAAYAVLGVVLAVAVLAFLYGQAKHQVSSRGSEVTALQAKTQTLQAEVSSLSPYTSFIALREARSLAVASLVDSRFDWAHAFHEFGRVLPRNISISSLDGTVGSATATATPTASTGASGATSATPPGSVPTFTLAGCATSQRAVATMLQRLRLIDGVAEVTLQSSTKAGAGTGGAGSGGCGSSQPSFTATVTFQALPSTSAAASAATGKSATVSSSTQSSSSTPATGGAQ
jgi:Tfp pilus assembly protein PilN